MLKMPGSIRAAGSKVVVSLAGTLLVGALVVLISFLVLPPLAGGQSAHAQAVPQQVQGARPSWPKPPELKGPANALGSDSQTDIWRRVRQGDSFSLSDKGLGTGVLVQSQGQAWREFRNTYIRPYGGLAILAALGAVVLFFLIRGRVRIEGGRTGRTLPRFNQAERLVHWYVASTFVLLAISGLVIMFGRPYLTPLIGKPAFAVVASAMMQGHNLFGPLFVVGIIALALIYVKDNLPRSADFVWFFKGGMFFIGHPPSWKNNAGEKGWFWIAVIGGLALSTSGLLMEFPWLAWQLQHLQLANLVHGAAGLIVIAVAIGHIYLGTIGVEGALDGMTSGRSDEAWAHQHHGLWAEEISGRPETENDEDMAPDAGDQVRAPAE